MLARFTSRPTIAVAALLIAATLAFTALSSQTSASGTGDHYAPGYPYATLSSVSR